MVHREAQTSSITLHNLGDTLYALLKEKARKEGKSLNRTIQELLEESVGLKKGPARPRKTRDVYDELCGAVSPDVAREMEDAEKEFEIIQEKDWK